MATAVGAALPLSHSAARGTRLQQRKCSSSGAAAAASLRAARPARVSAVAGASNKQVSAVAAPYVPQNSVKPDIDWDNLGFGLTPTAAMYVATCVRGEKWTPGSLRAYGPLELSPAAGVLNYGQGIFEGLKAYRTTKGRVVLFRPQENASRCAEGAERMSMPPIPHDIFVDAVKMVAAANMDYIPPEGKGSLYLRPLLIGTGPILGLAPAPEYTFVVYASPVASYFKGGQLTPIDLKIETEYHRAAPGGTGGTKCVGNYSPVLKTQLNAKGEGFSDVLYLDARENKYIEEVSSCNIFVVKGKNIATPPLGGTILPGITRKSIIALARERGYTVEERPVLAEEIMKADEAFCTGTAVVVVPVGSVTFGEDKSKFTGDTVAQELYKALTNLQTEQAPDNHGWLVQVEPGLHKTMH